MTRSFGDLVGKSVGVSHIPEIKGTNILIFRIYIDSIR